MSEGDDWLWGLPSEDHTGLPTSMAVPPLEDEHWVLFGLEATPCLASALLSCLSALVSAGQVQQWPSPVFWVSAQPRYGNPGSSSVRGLGRAPGRPGVAARSAVFRRGIQNQAEPTEAAATTIQVVWQGLRTVIPTVRGSGLLFKGFIVMLWGNACHWGKCGTSIKKNCPEIVPLIFWALPSSVFSDAYVCA